MRVLARSAVVLACSLPLAPDASAQTDFARPIYATGGAPTDFAWGDLDGDGRPDAAVVHSATDKLGLVFAEPGGGYSTPTLFTTGDEPRDVAIADFDLDGRPDVITFNDNAGTLTLVLRTAAGPVLSTWPAGGNGGAMAVGDLDGDGDPDVVTCNFDQKTLSVILGQGAAGLAAPVIYPVGARPGAIALEDFDGDGALDVVTANSQSSTLTLRPGDGNGGLLPATTLATLTGWMAAADLDQDGDVDIALSSSGDLVLVLNGPGGFAAPQTVPTSVDILVLETADLDQDGLVDLLVEAKLHGPAGSLSRMAGLGGGAFGQPVELAGPSLLRIAVDDADDDLRLDVIALHGGLCVLRGDGAGGLIGSPAVPIPAQASLYALADLNDDGLDDLVSAEPTEEAGPVFVQLGDGQGGWGEQGQAVQAAAFVELADVTGDGALDLLTAATSGSLNWGLVIAPGDGTGGFAAPATLVPQGFYVVRLAAADLDLDGDEDLALTVIQEALFGTQYRDLMAYRNDGSGQFTPFGAIQFYTSVEGGSPPDPVVLGDCNGDGLPDAVVLDQTNDHLNYFAGGVSGFGPPQALGFIGSSYGERLLTLADLDEDGALDLLVAQDPVQIWPGHGDGTFGPPQTLGAAKGDDVQLVDIDGDGDDEIVMDESNGPIPGHAVLVWHADGIGGYRLERYFSEPVTRSFATDADQDGRIDLLVVPGKTQSQTWPLGDGHVLYNHTLEAAWTDFGHGLAGSFGVPKLVGQGTLAAGSPGSLKLTGANPNKLAVLFIGATANPTLFKGGMLVPLPVAIMFMLGTSPTGAITLSWPSWQLMPPGTDWFFQYGIVDTAGPAGASLSNALRALQP
ncbi:MAG TPA: VCBS repeat-containing protein [Planctomycetota bacterium]|nr:VCBS repeat-containing protein [Planctomycetota bacterium]